MKLPAHFISATIWLVAFGLAAIIVAQLPLSAMMDSLTELALRQWLVWIAINLMVVALLTGRWLVITRALYLPCKFSQLLRVRQAGQVISFVTPGPQFGGEPFQVYWLWQRYKLPGHSAFLALALDRFYELWINFAILLFAVLALVTSTSLAFDDWPVVAFFLVAMVSLLALFGWVALKQPLRIRKWLTDLTQRWQHHERLQNLDTHWSQLSDCLQQLFAKQRPALGLALILSLLAWVAMIGEFWLLLRFVQVPVDLASFVFLFTAVRLAFLLPLPGGIGSVEAALFWGFQTLALPLSAAAGLILLMRLRDVIMLLAGAAALPGLQAPLPLSK